MIISKERLIQEADSIGFRAEILEKVLMLIYLLEAFSKDEFLKEKLALKGGTALNLFYFELARLSVDLDLNYIGYIDRENMLKERPEIESRIERICFKSNFILYRKPSVHAGGKMIWRYPSVLGNQSNIEIDLNFMYRVPLIPITKKDSFTVAGQKAQGISILDIHELAAGKLSALIDRGASRDIFDAHYLFHRIKLDDFILRPLFVIYAGMSKKTDLRTIEKLIITENTTEFKNRLLPLLSRKLIFAKTWSKNLIHECQEQFSRLLPLKENEHEFLTRLFDHNELKPELICGEKLAKLVKQHPALHWRMRKVLK